MQQTNILSPDADTWALVSSYTDANLIHGSDSFFHLTDLICL